MDLPFAFLLFDILSWEFIATLPPLGPLPNNFVFTMPERTDDTPPITLVLDIDETLVHCATRPLGKDL